MEDESENIDIPLYDNVATRQRWYAQSASLLASEEYGKYLLPEVMKVDPFYALHDLFSFCANAEFQLINTGIIGAEEEQSKNKNEEVLQTNLKSLRYRQSRLRGKISRYKEVIEHIRSKGDPSWPTVSSLRINKAEASATANSEVGTPSSDKSTAAFICDSVTYAKHVGESKRAAAKLLKDYEGLLEKAKILYQLYGEQIDDIKTSMTILESRENLEQARSIGRLTLLAIFFLPLSFTTSLFGMNFKEIGEDLSIWVYFAVSVPIFGVTVILCFWPRLARFCRTLYHRVVLYYYTLFPPDSGNDVAFHQFALSRIV